MSVALFLTSFSALAQLNHSAQLRNFSLSQKHKVQEALDIAVEVLNSEDFYQSMLSFEYMGRREFVQNNGMSNDEIYRFIHKASERFSPLENSVMDLDLSLYRQSFGRCSVVGYTTQSSPRIFINECFFSKFSPRQIAANIVHEWLHQLGFVHDYKPTARRPFSVPYAVGDMVSGKGN